MVGDAYPTCKSFTIDEIKKFIGVYILNGISISPRVEYKFILKDVDPVNGNNLCNRAFGRDEERRFKKFRALFTVQDTILEIPSRKTAPSHKIDPLLLHIVFTFDSA